MVLIVPMMTQAELDEHLQKLAEAAERVLDILKIGLIHGLVHGVEQDAFLVQQHIGIVADAPGHVVNALEQGQPPVIGADPVQIVLNFAVTIHIEIPPANRIGGDKKCTFDRALPPLCRGRWATLAWLGGGVRLDFVGDYRTVACSKP